MIRWQLFGLIYFQRMLTAEEGTASLCFQPLKFSPSGLCSRFQKLTSLSAPKASYKPVRERKGPALPYLREGNESIILSGMFRSSYLYFFGLNRHGAQIFRYPFQTEVIDRSVAASETKKKKQFS